MAIVGAAFTGLGLAVGMSSVDAALFAAAASKTLVQLLGTVAISALSTSLQGQPRAAGLRSSQTQTGGQNPCSFILGTYATAGVHVCPPMSHGEAGKTPNAYLTYVIEVSDVPGVSLSRLIVDGEYVTIGSVADPDYGLPIEGRFLDRAWIKFYNGSQTVADPMLLAKYGSYPQRPWSADMVGTGIAYAVLTFRYDREVFTNFPQVKFEIAGIPLYDPRKDSTVGGSGAHRWGTVATYEPTGNPYVMMYNILLGIALAGLGSWGGSTIELADLPLSSWFTAMNEADVDITLSSGGTQKRYRAGYEVHVTDEPAAILDEIRKAGAGKVADIGGVWKVRAGAPGLATFSFSDGDLLVDDAQVMDPFLGLDQTYNAITATYPEPASLWEAKEAPARFNATWEARDGGRRLVAELSLPAVNVKQQVQRLMQAEINDHQRMVQHRVPFSRRQGLIEPLDIGAWTSVRNGYSAKSFEVAEVTEDPIVSGPAAALREVSAADWGWVPADELPSEAPPAGAVPPTDVLVVVGVPGFDATAITLSDGVNRRRQSLHLTWTPSLIEAAQSISYEVRLRDSEFAYGYESPDGTEPALVFDAALDVGYARDLDGWAGPSPLPSVIFDAAYDQYAVNTSWFEPDASRVVIAGWVDKISAGFFDVSDGVLNGQEYSVRMEIVADYPTEPTPWKIVKTGSVGIAKQDFDGSGAVIARTSMLPAAAADNNFIGQLLPASVISGAEVQQLMLSPVATDFNKIHGYSLKFEGRKTGASNWTALFQERIKYAGVWGAWATLQSWTISGASYDVFTFAGQRPGGAEDYQYRFATTSIAANTDAFKLAFVVIREDI